MTFKRASGAILLFVFSIFATCGIAFSEEGHKPPALFTGIAAAQQFDDPDDPTIVRKRLVKVKFDILTDTLTTPEAAPDTADVVTLNLFDDVELIAVLDRIEATIPEFFSWIGHIDEVEDSKVLLIVGEGLIQGSVTLPDAFYKISSAGNAVHAIFEIDQTAFPPELDPIQVAPEKKNAAPEKNRVTFDAISADDGSTIDVMVFFTTAARIAAGGKEQITAQILEAYQDTNEGYRRSGVGHALRLIDPYAYDPEVDYSESNFDWSATIRRLRNTGDGQMDRVHDLRDQYKADIVVLLVEGDNSYCGVSYSMERVSGAFESSAFSLISRKCASINHSFAHELGHVMGSQHDHANAQIDGVYAYSHGYQAPDNTFRTIMAYQCPGGCPRINHWSNPDIAYDGQPTGIDHTDPVAAADNRRSLNNTAFTVANFRSSRAMTGSLTVTITPPAAVSAGAQWRVDGGEWIDSGQTQDGLPVGSHTVTFKPVDDWAAPAARTVTITSGQTTSISRAYSLQTGAIKVTITPPAAVSAGAQWRVDGGEWIDSGETQDGLPVGSHTVTFKPVDDWAAPAARTVTITSGQTTSISRAYTLQTGAIKVTITPPAAVSAGAQWRVDGGEWIDSGQTQDGLPVGSHTVTFKPVDDWAAPAARTVTITSGQTTSISRAYSLQTGAIKVTITPPAAVSAGAQWRVDGGEWIDSGQTQDGLPVGSHTVTFKPVDDWAAPAARTVTITSGQTTSISRAYSLQTGAIKVTITPPAAVSAGAQWRVDGGEWIDSGQTQDGLPVGSHTVTFKPVDDWAAPAARTVTVADGQTATLNTTYTQQPASEGSSPGDDDNPQGGGGSSDPGATDDSKPDNQPGNVVELSTHDNRHRVTLTSPAGTTIRDYRAIDNPDIDHSPERVDFSYGFFEFSVDGLEPGGTTTVTVELVAGDAQDTYYKYGPTADNPANHWYEFLYDGRTGAEIDGNRITLHFVDGQRGDDDLAANGIITDIGGPGVTVVGPSAENNDPPQSADSTAGGGGGCFIETSGYAAWMGGAF